MTIYPKILVTGASGFIGQALCSKFDSLGIDYRGVSRSNSHINSSVAIGDYFDEEAMKIALQDVKVVIHLAGMAHRKKSQLETDHLAYMRANSDLVAYMLKLAKQCGVEKFILVSSSKTLLEKESLEITGAERGGERLDPYSLSKLEAEKQVRYFCEMIGMQFVIVKPALVYGPGCKANFLNLLRMVNLGLPLPFGKALHRRSYIYVGNLVALLLKSAEVGQPTNFEIVAADFSISTCELIEKISTLMNGKILNLKVSRLAVKALFKLVGLSDGFEKIYGKYELNTDDAYRKLKWRYPYSFDDGLEATVSWFKSRL